MRPGQESKVPQKASASPASDASASLPVYSRARIHQVLQSYGLSISPEKKLSQDTTQAYDVYVYPSQPLTPHCLLEDSVRYFLAHRNTLRPRRVCFLLESSDEHPLALILQLSDLNTSAAEALHKLITDTTVQTIIKNSTFTKLFKPLYHRIHFLVIGASASPALIAQLKTPIAQAYTGKIQLDFMMLPKHHAGLVLTDYILDMLLHGKTQDVLPHEAYQRHCQKAQVFSPAQSSLLLEPSSQPFETSHQKDLSARSTDNTPKKESSSVIPPLPPIAESAALVALSSSLPPSRSGPQAFDAGDSKKSVKEDEKESPILNALVTASGISAVISSSQNDSIFPGSPQTLVDVSDAKSAHYFDFNGVLDHTGFAAEVKATFEYILNKEHYIAILSSGGDSHSIAHYLQSIGLKDELIKKVYIHGAGSTIKLPALKQNSIRTLAVQWRDASHHYFYDDSVINRNAIQQLVPEFMASGKMLIIYDWAKNKGAEHLIFARNRCTEAAKKLMPEKLPKSVPIELPLQPLEASQPRTLPQAADSHEHKGDRKKETEARSLGLEEKEPIIKQEEQKTPLDTSPQLPPYTGHMVHTLLKAYGIAKAPEALSTRETKAPFMIYAYSPQALTPQLFSEDNVRYFLAQRNLLRARRAGFLFQGSDGQPLAFILQLTDLNLSIAEQLRAQISTHSLQDVMQNTSILSLFKSLYRDVRCFFLGSAVSSELMEQLKTPLIEAFAGTIHVECIALPACNPTIALTELMLGLLQQGEKITSPTLVAFQRHRAQSVKALIEALEDLETRDLQGHRQIQEHLIVLFKYLLLEGQRAQRYGISGITTEAVEEILQRNQPIKKIIYQRSIEDIEPYLNLLDLKPLLQMLADIELPERLLQQLARSRQSAFERLKAWEAGLQQSLAQQKKRGVSYLWHQGKKAAHFVYHSSLIGLGAEFCQWIGKSINAKELIQRSVKLTILCCTLQPRLARAGYELTGRWLQEKHMPLIFKTAGAGLGAGATYLAGTYSFIRMLAITTFARTARQTFDLEKIDDEKACIYRPFSCLPLKFSNPSPTTYMRLTSLSVTALESWYTQTSIPLMLALGGMTGSISATQLGQRFIKELRTPQGEAPTEDQIFLVFLLATSGYDMGQALAGIGVTAYTTITRTLAERARVLGKLRQLEQEGFLPDLRVEIDSILTHPRLWFKPDNRLHLEWRNLRTGFFYQADCQMQPQPSLQGEVLQCGALLTKPPRLMS